MELDNRNDARVKSTLLAVITSNSNAVTINDLQFNNLHSLTKDSITSFTKASPSSCDGLLPARIDSQIREDLRHYTVRSTNTARPCLPKFFIEGK